MNIVFAVRVYGIAVDNVQFILFLNESQYNI